MTTRQKALVVVQVSASYGIGKRTLAHQLIKSHPAHPDVISVESTERRDRVRVCTGVNKKGKPTYAWQNF